ncbi:MAG: threonylcarbamoyl-AMP synthase [Alistipes sp.]|nr:threonylcarbamoyl-AMP synthase [Alistipes sp.]
MLVRIYDKNPSERDLQRVADILSRGGVVAYPTDGVYAFGCALRSAKGVARLHALCGKEVAELSVVFDSLSSVADYCRVDNAAFRILKRNLPGPFTFILPASSRMPDKVLSKRRTIGVRMPANALARAVAACVDGPLLTASVVDRDGEQEYTTDPSLIEERYGREIDLVVDGGIGSVVPTTVVDLTEGEPEVVREGGGELK